MFVHLHTHSYFSFLDAVPSPQELAQAAAVNGMRALALTDHHGLTGAIAFYTACRALEVKPILGIELGLRHRNGHDNLVFLAENLTGWANLCKLSSAVQTASHRNPARGITLSELSGNTSGLICLTGTHRGSLSSLVNSGQSEESFHLLEKLAGYFPGRLYVELQIYNPGDQRRAARLEHAANMLGLPTVATNAVHFIEEGHHPLHRLLIAMQQNIPLHAVSSETLAPDGAYFTSTDEMLQRFREFPAALTNVQEIVSRCNVELPLDVPHYPSMKLPQGQTAMDVLRAAARLGAKEEYLNLTPEIEARLAHELKIIEKRGYAPLFLIMSEILSFARKEGVPTASRGSASSSLVAHCLGITTPDPIEHNLYFERFLNPARKSPPDIDTDLCSKRRDKVLRYVYEKYGDDRVAMVATVNRFRGRSALREVAKAHGLQQQEIKKLVEGLSYRGWGPRGGDVKDPFAELMDQYPQHRRIFHDAAAVLDFPRHLSVHPGGMVISPGPLTDLVPLNLAGKGLVITQFDLDAVQRMGLVKIDLLGTRGLSVLGDVAEKVHSWKRTDFSSPLDVLEAIPQDDEPTAILVESTQTIGCFQIESPGMRATLREIQAKSPQDILVALALYRPGPMTGGLKDAFVRRHLGQEQVQHLHPTLSTLLADTHGVILYQEQVLRIASELAGLSLADADLLRRAMSHFDPGERMKTLKARFVAGAQARRDVPPATAEQIWELMAAFAGYGFPKAHAASYAQVAWQSAWCKAHFPAEFMAAVLANWGGYYRQDVYINEARRMGLRVRSPHINHSYQNFRVAYPKGKPVLYMGMDQVRDLTIRTQQRLIKHRPFKTLDDFLTNVDPRPQEAENLVKIGALSGLGTIPDLLVRIEHGGWRKGQPFLFEMPAPFGHAGEWKLKKRLAAQKQVLGVEVDAHPLSLINETRRSQLDVTSTRDAAARLGERVRVLGMRETVQRFFHAGVARHVIELADESGMLFVVFSEERYRHIRHVLRRNTPLIVSGEIITDPLWQVEVLRGDRIEPVNFG